MAMSGNGTSFAQSQMQKYGWEKGKGLGKSETGITDAIKPKLKFDTAGIGHNAGEQFSFHWWDHVFNKAAKNIEVEHSEEGVSVKRKGEKSNLISNKRSTQKGKPKPLLYGSFVKHGTLKPDGLVAQNDQSSSSSSDESDDEDCPPVSYEGNDEKLFKACGGRTAHKGARHGLHLSGKLKRIEEQENLHSNGKIPAITTKLDKSLPELSSSKQKLKKKKKNRKKESPDSGDQERLFAAAEDDDDGEDSSHKVGEVTHTIAAVQGLVSEVVETVAVEKKRKKKKKRTKEKKSSGSEQDEVIDNDHCMDTPSNGLLGEQAIVVKAASKKIKKTKKRKHQSVESTPDIEVRESSEDLCSEQLIVVKKKKKKNKSKARDEVIVQEENVPLNDRNIAKEQRSDKQKKKKKTKGLI